MEVIPGDPFGTPAYNEARKQGLITPNGSVTAAGAAAMRQETANGASVSANTPPPSTGKAFIEPEVKGQRRKVDLMINLTYKDEKGNPVDSKLTQGLTKSAEKSWSGNVGGFKLNADFDDPNATTVNVNLHPGAGISNVNRVGGNTLNLFLGGYCSFAGRIDPVRLTRPPYPRERRDPIVRPLEPQSFRSS
ncbi:hypothetical protein [Janthinobacterium sp. K2C7]|uniref:hypothetical protein n=1 Tax=unclassified Janthinobacterium TaxID=2610881 RepID=UPI001834689D|nr:hypothetical protein [Janthinobacterium sp. K2C7]MBB5384494.1 hypothetical protein [Janthinobacterium sp. K2Li3]MBB5389770.1 hypothetical protein [Janthinobacterium sp. K2E3]